MIISIIIVCVPCILKHVCHRKCAEARGQLFKVSSLSLCEFGRIEHFHGGYQTCVTSTSWFWRVSQCISDCPRTCFYTSLASNSGIHHLLPPECWDLRNHHALPCGKQFYLLSHLSGPLYWIFCEK